jgi:hypothetical protein
MQILKRTIDLLAPLAALPADPAAMGAWWRDVLPPPTPGLADGDAVQAALKLAGDLEGVAIDFRRDLAAQLLQAEKQIADRLRGDFDAQKAAGLIVTADFPIQGRSAGGLILVDPAPTPWRDLTPQLFESRWLVLGWPRFAPAGLTATPRRLYSAERAKQLTEKLERERRAEAERYAAEERRIVESFDRDIASRPETRIRQLEAEIAELKSRIAQ